MSLLGIAEKITELCTNLQKEQFIYDFLIAYGASKSTVSLLKKGTYNRSKCENEVLYAKKILFRVERGDNLFNAIDGISSNDFVQKHMPRFAMMTDFEQLVAKDLKLGKTLDIVFNDLPKYYDFFLPLAGSEVYHSANDNEADRNAAYKMAILYDCLIEENPGIYQSKEQIHHLNIFLSRLLFCFFAEDTGIFPEDSIFTNTLVQHTNINGSDTHLFLDRLFARLNTIDVGDLPEFLTKFPYVNGGLFKDKITSPIFSAKAHKILVELGELQWKNINPDIFGSMIQAVTTGVDRSKLGQHYTSVPNILKLIKPLFLDEFYEELEKATTVNQLYKLQNRIANAKFLDPACGSGNFLIITYKELRVLEIEIIKKMIELSGNNMLNTFASQIKISQFYGIEIDDFAHEIAILSLWLAEHQMNIVFEERLFEYAEVASILPLKSIGNNILCGNATRIKWETVCPANPTDEVYVVGNPPFEGSRKQSLEQKDDLRYVFGENYKSLDYICAWFYLAANFIRNKNAKCALVSTNSISQGLLADFWKRVLVKNIEIGFAYPSFKWKNNAKNVAGVVVVIIGLRNIEPKADKFIFKDNLKTKVTTISPYLSDISNIIVTKKEKSISGLPDMSFGNMAADKGYLLFTEDEINSFISQNPTSKKFIKEVVAAKEFLNGKRRFCLWLEGVDLNEALNIKGIRERVDNVKKIRLNSSRPELARTPHLFAQITQPKNTDIIVIPRATSENRLYIPIGYFSSDYISLDSCMVIGTKMPWHFAVVTSKMHMLWTKAVGGKLKTDPRYSATLCYNTFPFPKIDKKQQENLNQYVFDILDARANHIGKTLAWMYDLKTMPSDLKKAHQALDEAIERCYRLQPFNSDSERLEYLFKLYEKMIAEEQVK